MKMECAGSISSANVTEAEIGKAFADDGGRGEFIILSEADQAFVQASGEVDGPYTLEYREGSQDRHFQCVSEVRKAQVEAAFLKYLKRDSTWKNDFQWQELNRRPWWKFW